eukprot:GHVS01022653.1.p1 GENE.GHVS01022653.1~~GHVS01022653.1.p1  ORF type:complete len:564 (-),score=66.97 GHVS01022653.1:1186-2877(-)
MLVTLRKTAVSALDIGLVSDTAPWGRRSLNALSDGIFSFSQSRKDGPSGRGVYPYVVSVLNSKVYGAVDETPLDFAPALSEKTGNTILLKREDLHPVFSFKLRGAYNKIAHLTDQQRATGVVACSAGNHAQGVAYSAKQLGMKAKIFMPATTPAIKVNNVRRLGAEVVVEGNAFDEAAQAARECCEQEGKIMVHPFDDPLVIAGQGTVALELLKQTSREKFDGIFVCCGGGGLLSGVGSLLKAVVPHVKVFGVEAADAPTMTQSLLEGRIVDLESVGTFADGAAVRRPGDHTFRICQDVVDEMILCSTDEICAAIKDGFTDIRVVLEPAGALAIAGMTKYLRTKAITKGKYIAICSGANMDFARLRFVSDRADTTETLLCVIIPEKPGAFRKMYDIISPSEVTQFSYRFSSHPRKDDKQAYILLSFRSHPGESKDTVPDDLRLSGYEVIDLQDNEMAKVHGRYIVGGCGSEVLTDELLYAFEFPENPGALKRFLYSLSEEWNISLFHYRNYGSDVGKVLVGIQVPPATGKSFEGFLLTMQALGYTYREETHNDMYRQFLTRPT